MEALNYRQSAPIRHHYDKTMVRPDLFWAHYTINTHQNDGSTDRCTTESYISRRFEHSYHAKLTHYLDTLIAISNTQHCIGAVGINVMSQHEHCYVEHYLEHSAQQVLSEQLGHKIDRHRLLEIGNLATSHPQATWALFVYIAYVMKYSDHDWAVITANSGVQFWLKQFNVNYVVLAEAKEEALPENEYHWGRYYDEKPLVIAFEMGADHHKLNHDGLLQTFKSHYLSDIAESVAVIKS